jgi:hypothetical protein
MQPVEHIHRSLFILNQSNQYWQRGKCRAVGQRVLTGLVEQTAAAELTAQPNLLNLARNAIRFQTQTRLGVFLSIPVSSLNILLLPRRE